MAQRNPVNQNRYVVLFISAVLMFGAFNAVMITGDEYDPEMLVWMNLGLDIAMTICLVALLSIVLTRAPRDGLTGLSVLVGLAGLAAGIVKIGVRFTSDHGWWTGHYTYALGG